MSIYTVGVQTSIFVSLSSPDVGSSAIMLRVKRGGQETGEYRSLCYMDFWLGGQSNG